MKGTHGPKKELEWNNNNEITISSFIVISVVIISYI